MYMSVSRASIWQKKAYYRGLHLSNKKQITRGFCKAGMIQHAPFFNSVSDLVNKLIVLLEFAAKSALGDILLGTLF